MSLDSEEEVETLENAADVIDELAKDLKKLYEFRDLFFENHPIELSQEKNKLVDEKKKELVEKFEKIDADRQIPVALRAHFLYLKGRCYNISPSYDPHASQCLSKAVKLNPRLVDAWNELGECYWKNLNIKEAKASFEGALKHERNRLSLRCLSIILRQESNTQDRSDPKAAILQSVELAKEAVAQDIKDGVSWTVLGNAYLCQFFTIAQDPATLKLCLSAYKQAYLDPIAKGQPDLYYNRGMALKYEECYSEALDSFDLACRLDPPWEPPRAELRRLVQYLRAAGDLQRTRGRIKAKRLGQMAQSIDPKMLGVYGPGTKHTFGSRRDVTLELATIDKLQEGTNEGKVLLGKVVGSIHSENTVPFTFALIDSAGNCACVTVYNLAHGRGVIIGDTITIPEPKLSLQSRTSPLVSYEFTSIRVNNPLSMLVGGKRVAHAQVASTRVSSSYEPN